MLYLCLTFNEPLPTYAYKYYADKKGVYQEKEYQERCLLKTEQRLKVQSCKLKKHR